MGLLREGILILYELEMVDQKVVGIFYIIGLAIGVNDVDECHI